MMERKRTGKQEAGFAHLKGGVWFRTMLVIREFSAEKANLLKK
ncbi:MAG: hypothetical protein ACYS9T_06870 [Planctomycetota bacterium]|jgi:hypothetical protein